MSQSNHQFDYEYVPKRETRGVPPISSLPSPSSGGLGGTVDPTEEIRHLINQLQASASEARDRVAFVERERDQLRSQLQEARVELHEVVSREEESRARFVEVTSVIRERDELLASLDQHHRSIAELQRRLDALQKHEIELQRQRGALIVERDSTARERDAAARDRDEAVRERDDARNKATDAQKHLVSIRQARDSAQAHFHEVTQKIQDLNDQLAEVSFDRDALKREITELGEWRQRCEQAITERDQIAAKLQEVTQDLDSHRQRLLDLAEQQTRVDQSSGEHAAALTQAREDVLNLTQERDAARTRAQEKTREVDELREELQQVRADAARDELQSAERDALNQRIESLTGERDDLQTRVASLIEDRLDDEDRDQQLLAQLGTAQKGRDEAITSLQAAQKQIEHIIRDRDVVRQQGVDQALELEAQLEAARRQLADFDLREADEEARVNAILRERDSALEKAHNYENQRLQSIDLAAQLDAARREIKRLTADLAEVRLEAKAATGRLPRPKPGGLPPPLPADVTGARDASMPELSEEPLTEKEGRAILAEMKRCYASFSKNPGDFSLLNEMHCHIEHFSDRAQQSGFLGLYRLAHSFANLAQDLYKFPEQVNPSALRTVNQTFDFLSTLLKQRDYAAIRDTAQANIFAVDDDQENCEAIRMAMENIAMRTQTAQEPSVALAALHANKCDLIFLDIALPHMDGFELCQHIRAISQHARTPIVFLTGLTTMENRVQSSLSGGNDFVGKPFNLHELGLKAVSLILKSSLNME